MMIDDEFQRKVRTILDNDQRYPYDAYEFVNEVVAHTVKRRAEANQGGRRHVSGQELLEGFLDLALIRFGPLSLEVLTQWSINEGLDVGNIVFNMIDYKLLRKSDEDSLEDFKGGFDFKEAFLAPFRPNAIPAPLPAYIIA